MNSAPGATDHSHHFHTPEKPGMAACSAAVIANGSMKPTVLGIDEMFR